MNILENTRTNYKRWADKKLQGFSNKLDDLIVEINNPTILVSQKKILYLKLLINIILYFSKLIRALLI